MFHFAFVNINITMKIACNLSKFRYFDVDTTINMVNFHSLLNKSIFLK